MQRQSEDRRRCQNKLGEQKCYLDEAEPDVVLADVLVRLVEEGRRRDAQQVPLYGQPLE